MANFFAKHGIKLDLTFYEETGFSDWWNCDHSINLHSHYGRATSGNWVTHRTAGIDLDEEGRCSLFLHELGHRLGLPDTYPDPDCPDRPRIGPEDDIMNNSWLGADNTKLYPYAIKELLGELCE